MLCIIIPTQDGKFTVMINNRIICTSKHKDYSVYHFKANGHAGLAVGISKFVFVDERHEICEVIEAFQLKNRGVTYETAMRSSPDLTHQEIAEVALATIAVKMRQAADTLPAQNEVAPGSVEEEQAQPEADEETEVGSILQEAFGSDEIEVEPDADDVRKKNKRKRRH